MRNPFQTDLPDAQRRDGMLSTRHLFEPVARVRGGDNLRVAGVNGVYTLSADGVTTQETTTTTTTTGRGLEVYRSGTTVRVRPGTVLGLMPTISGTALDNATPPTLTCALDVTRYVVISLDTTLSTTAYGGETFVQNATANTAVITLETTAPDASDLISSTGDFQILLATIVNGVITQNGYASITGYVTDNGSVNGTGQLVYQTA